MPTRISATFNGIPYVNHVKLEFKARFPTQDMNVITFSKTYRHITKSYIQFSVWVFPFFIIITNPTPVDNQCQWQCFNSSSNLKGKPLWHVDWAYRVDVPRMRRWWMQLAGAITRLISWIEVKSSIMADTAIYTLHEVTLY